MPPRKKQSVAKRKQADLVRARARKRSAARRVDRLTTLQPEVLERVLLQLDLVSLQRVCRANRAVAALCKDRVFLKRYARAYGLSVSSEPKSLGQVMRRVSERNERLAWLYFWNMIYDVVRNPDAPPIKLLVCVGDVGRAEMFPAFWVTFVPGRMVQLTLTTHGHEKIASFVGVDALMQHSPSKHETAADFIVAAAPSLTSRLRTKPVFSALQL